MRGRTIWLATVLALSSMPVIAAVFTDDFAYTGEPRWPWVVKNAAPRVEDGRLLSVSSGSPRDALVTAFDGDEGLTNYRVEVDVDPQEDIPGTTWPDAVIAVRANDWYRGSDRSTGDTYQINFLRKNAIDDRERQKGPINYLEISRTKDGGTTRLARTMLHDLPTQPFRVAVTVRDIVDLDNSPLDQAQLKVEVDGVRALAAVDRDPLAYGGIGLFTIWEAQTYYDNVRLETLDAKVVPLPAALPLLAGALSVLAFMRRKNASG